MKDNAVSPVIGVLLMLVVVIIIAAIVSAFAGGMTSEQSKAPQMTIEATYSLTDGMKITHGGGDTLAVADVDLLVRPTKSFGNYEHLSWKPDRSVIYDFSDSTKSWKTNQSGSKKMTVFEPGDSIIIARSDLNKVQTTEDGTQEGDNSYYGFNLTSALGKSFKLSVLEKDGGKEFAYSLVKIVP